MRRMPVVVTAHRYRTQLQGGMYIYTYIYIHIYTYIYICIYIYTDAQDWGVWSDDGVFCVFAKITSREHSD